MTLAFAIIAHDVDNSLKITRHGVLGNISCTSFPCCRHGLLRHDRLFANWASIIKPRELAKAVGMDCMSARQILRRLTRREHVLSADWTIVLVLVLETLVGVKHTHRNTHATLIAVTEGVGPSHSAETTLCAMKGLF
jgi:hypothetical protein